MGILGLSAFIREHPRLGTEVSWESDPATTKSTDTFIVDGNAFVHHYALQYRSDWIHGGKTEMMERVYKTHCRINHRTICGCRKRNGTRYFVFARGRH